MTEASQVSQASVVTTATVTSAAATVLAPIIIAYAKSKGVDLSVDQGTAAAFAVAVSIGSATNRMAAALDVLLAALSNRLTQIVNKVGGVQ